MKRYILHAKECRRKVREIEEFGKQEENKIKNEAFEFLLKYVKMQLGNLEFELAVEVKQLNEKELVRRLKDLPEMEKKMTNLSDKFPEILTYKSSSMKDKEETEKFKERYEAIVKAKNDYVLVMKQQVEEKEVDKELRNL